ncbi:NADH-quinone oxidoreductase subunit NuoK [Planctomicrobium sp. SH664]|uniref:NADH-quinone oxidoreductase subunit NuoK n=1 Tax=Planctomicrobium sp. SH664 TaxID=3448125 RepID=UPI003F5C0468
MTGEYEPYLAVGAALFVIGAIGFLTRRNLIMIILSAELMLHGVSLTLVTFGSMHHTLEGQVFTIFVLTIAACEAGLALALILALYQKSNSLDINLWTALREPDLPPPVDPGDADKIPQPVENWPKLYPSGAAPVFDMKTGMPVPPPPLEGHSPSPRIPLERDLVSTPTQQTPSTESPKV